MVPIAPKDGKQGWAPGADGVSRALWLPLFGMGRSRRIRRILELAGWQITHRKRRADAFAGWGRKDSGQEAARLAARHGKPAVAVEDGFLRSVGLGLEGAEPISLTVDMRGVYYDAAVPSDLEIMLQEGDWSDPALLGRARRVRERIVGERLTKYNASHEPWPARLPAAGFALVVDQTRGDRSLVHGGADADTFRRMLRAARSDNPGVPVLVKTHPDVLTGKRRSCFDPADLAAVSDLHLCTENVDPWLLLGGAERVYTATSQLGFEAILAGKPVSVFGAPFYAGWGLTEDAAPVPRRTRSLGLDAFVAAALVTFPLYYDPLGDELCPVETALDRLVLWRDLRRANQAPTFCVGFSRADRPVLSAALGAGPRRPAHARRAAGALSRAHAAGGRIVAAAADADLRVACDAAGVGLLVANPGPLPALGPAVGRRITSLYFDPAGSAAGSRVVARLAAGDVPSAATARAERLIARLRRTWTAQGDPAARPRGEIALAAGAPSGSGNGDLIRAMRDAHPGALVAFAPAEPDAPVPPGVDRLVAPADLAAWIAWADAVWASSSWIGLAALMVGRPVATVGDPAIAGWGLTRDTGPVSPRGRTASLAELVAAALILEPVYVDERTGLACDPEFVLDAVRRPPPDATAFSGGGVLTELRGRLRRTLAGS